MSPAGPDATLRVRASPDLHRATWNAHIHMTQVLRLSDLIADGRLAGKRVFIRADLNVPQDDAGKITEDTRIRASVPAIRRRSTRVRR